MYQPHDIMHENGRYWVLRQRNPKRNRNDFYVFRIEGTHSVRCGTFAFADETESLRRAVADCDRRAAA